MPTRTTFRTRITVQGLMAAMVASLVTAVTMVSTAPSADAAVGSNFDPAHIISDNLFYDGSAMSAQEIQAFLDAKVVKCRPELSAGPHDPIVCLKDYTMTTVTKAADQYCSGTYVGAANEKASTIIAKAAQACNISPKVLLVLLQKEQSLVTHDNPSTFRYDKATGFGCHDDDQPCIAQYRGFQNQVYQAARQFQRYVVNASQYNFKVGGTYNIRHQTTAIETANSVDCGYRTITIANKATAGLYNYTPYTPNQAALNNLYGTGNVCSAYGNRNFWRIYSDWFGDPKTGIPLGVTVDRIGGANRFDSAVLISQSTFGESVPVVYIATGYDFPDALSAAPAAAMAGGPLLLVEPRAIPAVVEQELTRLKPAKIIVVGGAGVVSDAVLARLGNFSSDVQRIGGQNRYEVSRAIATAAFAGNTSAIAYVATGNDYPDALSASAAAGSLDVPVILVDGKLGAVDAATAALIATLGVSEIRIVGGTGVVSSGMEASLKALPSVTAVSRVGGANRYVVSHGVNAQAFTASPRVFLASGEDFPDALAGAVIAGAGSAPLYVIPPTCIPGDVSNSIVALGATKVTLLGGTGALSASVASFRRC